MKSAFRCPNTACPGRVQEQIEHGISRYALNIEGLGPETIALLLQTKKITSLADIYALRYEDLINLPLFKEKKTTNTLESIKQSTVVPIDRFIFALGIRFIGRETAEILAKRIVWPFEELQVEDASVTNAANPSLFGEEVTMISIHAITPIQWLQTLSTVSAEDIHALDGVGGTVADSLLEWIADPMNQTLIGRFYRGRRTHTSGRTTKRTTNI